MTSILSSKHIAFLGNDDAPSATSLVVAAGETLFRAINSRYGAWFSRMTTLLLEIPAVNPNVVIVIIPIGVPCTDGPLYLFDDLLLLTVTLQPANQEYPTGVSRGPSHQPQQIGRVAKGSVPTVCNRIQQHPVDKLDDDEK